MAREAFGDCAGVGFYAPAWEMTLPPSLEVGHRLTLRQCLQSELGIASVFKEAKKKLS